MKTKSKKSKTEKLQAVVPQPEQPLFQCRACDSTNHEVLLTLPALKYAGTTSDGVDYEAIVTHRVRCLSCGQVGMKNTYEFRAEKE